ncbi:hypothetical protein SLA2020_117550 [Shorea laevis]
MTGTAISSAIFGFCVPRTGLMSVFLTACTATKRLPVAIASTTFPFPSLVLGASASTLMILKVGGNFKRTMSRPPLSGTKHASFVLREE